jgi:hypothetical protein
MEGAEVSYSNTNAGGGGWSSGKYVETTYSRAAGSSPASPPCRKSKWEKLLADWMMATGVSLVCQEMHDKEAERVERNDGWRRVPFP